MVIWSWAMELPAGTYAFIMEIVDITNPDTPVAMGDPSAVFFIVAEDGGEIVGYVIGELREIMFGGVSHRSQGGIS